MNNLDLAGLDGRDIASDRNPYLHLAAVQGARGGGGLMARRQRTARLTPGGLRQPPEVMGVDADVRIPNELQPMNGEMDRGRETGDGRPGFFGKLMPPPTGVANGVGVGSGFEHVFGAPTGMVKLATGSDRFGWRPPVDASAYRDLSGLPHFALGGVLPAGGTGVVGEEGEEAITALPGGGVKVTPKLDLNFTLQRAFGAPIPLLAVGNVRFRRANPPERTD